jgi:hypothetical protein
MPSGIPDGCSERLCGFLENPHKPLSRRRNAVLAAPGSSQKNSRPSRGDLRERPICSAKGVNLLFTITAYETHAFWLRLNMEWAPVAEHIGARFIFGRAYILASARPKPRASARATSLRHWRHAVIAIENARLSFANERASWKSTRVHRVHRERRRERRDGLRRDYHAAIGEIIINYNGSLERYAGDGVMVVFNDPVPVENSAPQAVLMALEVTRA